MSTLHCRWLTTIPVLVAAVAGVTGCGGGDDADRPGTGAAPTPSATLMDAEAWHVTDNSVETRGLDVRFDALGGEVQIWTGDPPATSAGLATDVVLADTAVTYETSNSGVTFQVRIRATGSAVGATLEMSLRQGSATGQFGGELEAEDVRLLGQWIEVEFARLVNTP